MFILKEGGKERYRGETMNDCLAMLQRLSPHSWEYSLNHGGWSIKQEAAATYADKLERFRARVEADTKAAYAARGYTDMDIHYKSGIETRIKEGKKYDKVDVGSSGKFMIEKDTGDIYGIKGYGVIHRGHRYGSLDTIEDYFWGEYHPQKK